MPADAALTPYVGRFAPSPTGPLHFGSLVAAVGSYLQARSYGGRWLVRIEDIDPPREQAGASDAILRTLDSYGMDWDGQVLYQHTRGEAYRASIDQLQRNGLIYACRCSRKAIAETAQQGPLGHIYPGTCRNRAYLQHRGHAQALRVFTQDETIRFEDALLGPQTQNLARTVGDFVIHRADGLFAYQLAVVVDDAEQGMTEVVRGSDLLDQTARQIHLQHLLGLPTPGYLHLPVALNADGNKLSKQTYAPPVDNRNSIPTLLKVLAFLGQQPPAAAEFDRLDDLLDWAVQHWAVANIPAVMGIAVDGD